MEKDPPNEDEPNESGSGMSLEDLNIKGDVIGDTAYSQRFVISTLLTLTKFDTVESLSDFTDKDLCTVWDMTTEEDVATFLIDHDAIDIFHEVLKNAEDDRLLEVILGMTANMSCYKNVIADMKQKRDFVTDTLLHLKSADPLVLVQVLRFAYTCIYNDAADCKFWLERCADADFQWSLKYIMENSINEDVLINSLEMLNCACSICVDSDKALFAELFGNEDYVKSLMTAFQELSSSLKSPVKLNEEREERCHMIYLTIMWSYSNLDEFPSMFNEEETEKFIGQLGFILKRCWKKKNSLSVDATEYVTGILSALSFPVTANAKRINDTFAHIWKTTLTIEDDGKDPDFEEESFAQSLRMEFVHIAANYFSRIIKLWPLTEVKFMFKSGFSRDQIVRLFYRIREDIQSQRVDPYYSCVCDTLNKLFSLEDDDDVAEI